MAVTEAKDPNKKDKPNLSASGGNSADGHGVWKFVNPNPVGEEGVVTRGAKGDHERFLEAEKFMKSKVEVAKMKPEDFEKAKEKTKKEADAKPTAVGADVSALKAGGQPAKETEKQEKADLASLKNEGK